jgi:WD40 repeat protein
VAQVAPRAVQALAAAGPGTVLVASGRTLEAWGLPASPAPAWEDRPTAAVVSPARRQVLAGFADGRVRRVPAAELEVRHQGAVRALAEVPGEERPEALRLLSAGDDGKVLAQRWSGEVKTLAEAPGARMVALAVAPDGTRAAWASSAGEVTLYSLSFGRDIVRLRGPPARSLAFAPGGRRLAVGRADQRLQVLDAETGAEVLLAEAFDAEVTAVAWLNPAAVVVARADGALSEYLVDGRQVARRWTGATRRLTALAADEARQRVVAGAIDGQVWVWSLEGAGPVAQLPADASEVATVGFLGDALLFVGGDRLVHEVPLP